jgi:hypothetical protein
LRTPGSAIAANLLLMGILIVIIPSPIGAAFVPAELT